MKRIATLITMAMFATVAGCSHDDKLDDSLQNDLSLAAQQQPAQLDSISALERGYTNAPAYATPTRTTPTTSRTSTTARRSTSSTSRSSSGSASTGSATASAPKTVEVKHTKRDAAIGAAAGAVIGATTSKDKVKGAVIGAAAGGILGAVIGNNVDKSKKTVPPQ